MRYLTFSRRFLWKMVGADKGEGMRCCNISAVFRARRLLIGPALLFLLCCVPAAALAADAQGSATAAPDAAPNASTDASTDAEPDVRADSLSQIWNTRASDVSTLLDEAATLQTAGEALAEPLSANVQAARNQFARLSSLYQASRGHPTEQLTLVQQMHNLQQSLKKNIAPLEDIAAAVNKRLEEIVSLQNSMQAAAKESAADGVREQVSDAGAQALNNYSRILDQAKKTLAPAAARLSNILAPSKATLARIDQSIAEIEGGLVGVWEDYYVTPSDNTLDALASTPVLLGDWVSSLDARMGFAYPQSAPEWMDALKSFFAAALVMAILAVFVVRGGRTLPDRWKGAVEGVIKGAWVWAGLGLSILSASTNQYGGVYFAFVLSGSLIIIAGVAALTWRLRIAVLPELESEPSPLFRLYLPAAVGVLMLFSDLPTRILGIVWGMVMVAFAARIFSMNKRLREEGVLPLLERLSYSCSLAFGLGSLLVAVAGYARLAILVFMVLFALVNTILLGSALMALFDMLADRLFSKTTKPVRNAVAQAIGIPAAWVLSLICTFPWVWAVPGARYLLEHLMSMDYTVGEATFDFSKLLIIALLFFLFRSFVSLGRASLEHLPDRLPSMECGVIPPLRTLMTYGLWALFGIVSLGMLGVNFTSLAVVAGGLSVGIGFGMQNIFNNLISGLLLIFGRTILVGDYVDVAGASGTVRAINIRSTTIETPERALIYVPNSSIMAGQVTNWTRNSRVVRRSLNIGVAYGTDTELVATLLLQAAKAQEHILQFPKTAVFFSNFGDSALNFTLNVFIDDFDNATSVMSNLNFAVEKLFTEHGIDIPFPQLTLHVPGPAGEGGEIPVIEKTLDTAKGSAPGSRQGAALDSAGG